MTHSAETFKRYSKASFSVLTSIGTTMITIGYDEIASASEFNFKLLVYA